jgi:hypothetical protein
MINSNLNYYYSEFSSNNFLLASLIHFSTLIIRLNQFQALDSFSFDIISFYSFNSSFILLLFL